MCGGIPLSLLTRLLFGYSSVARFRFRNNPETLQTLEEFIARRNELDRQAAKHRLDLIAENDPRVLAGNLDIPVYALSGLLDPIVPWVWVRHWLRGNCDSLREYRVIPQADHNVLSTTCEAAAAQILLWMRSIPDRNHPPLESRPCR
jgi:pimeloyl-ACP methyl ester carboxylesterase